MNQNNLAQKFNDEFQKALEKEIFDVKISANWHKIALQALGHASPISLGVSAKEFNDLVGIEIDEINLYQFAVLNNNLEKTSAIQLNVPLVVYCNIINVSNSLAVQWNERTSALRAEITARLVREQAGLDDTAKVEPFKVVRAEA
jgi:hypothetical protein